MLSQQILPRLELVWVGGGAHTSQQTPTLLLCKVTPLPASSSSIGPTPEAISDPLTLPSALCAVTGEERTGWKPEALTAAASQGAACMWPYQVAPEMGLEVLGPSAQVVD